MTAASEAQRTLMDDVYRYQRHFYDVTRRNYLLGRDRLIAELAPPPGGSVLESAAARAAISWPSRGAIQAFASMASTFRPKCCERRGAPLRGTASMTASGSPRRMPCRSIPGALFGIERFDRVFFSYTLSMIPDWRGALTKGASLLTPGGKLQFVDFGALRRTAGNLSKRTSTSGWRFFTCRPARRFPKNSPCWAVGLAARSACDNLYRGYAIAGSLAVQNG